MKGLPIVLALLLLVSVVPVAGNVPAGNPQTAAAGNSDIISRMIAELDREINGITHPLSTACTSPAFAVYETVTNTGDESKDLDHCIQFFAVQAGDTAQCANIQRGAPKTKCYCLIASDRNDIGICDQVPMTGDPQAYLKIDCLNEVAVRNNNPAACEAMGNQKINRMFVGEISRQTCRQRLASGVGVGESTL